MCGWQYLLSQGANFDSLDEEKLIDHQLEGEFGRVPRLSSITSDFAFGAPFLIAVAQRDFKHISRAEPGEALQTFKITTEIKLTSSSIDDVNTGRRSPTDLNCNGSLKNHQRVFETMNRSQLNLIFPVGFLTVKN